MRNIYLITILLVSYLCSGQSGDQDSWSRMPDFAAKSPEAAAFQRYGDYNVNLAKGSTNISIPLYTLSAGNYSLPIALSYQPTGIKVNQDATWVGLGWSLQAGAQIIVDIRDTADENVQGLLPDQQAANTYLNSAAPWDFCAPQMQNLRTQSWIKDVYHFSSPTASGKFILGDSQGDNNIHVYPPEAFKVETEGSIHARRFTITDTQGNQYIFSTTREVSNQVGVAGSQDYVSAYYVDQIKTPTNDIINFTYTNDGWHSKLNVNDQVVQSRSFNYCPGASNLAESISSSQPRNSVSTTKTYKISAVEYKDVRIVFEGGSGRLDLATPSQLAQAQYPTQNVVPSYLKFVKINRKVNGVFEFFKGFELRYDYFDSGINTLEYYRKRLKLTEVVDFVDDLISTKLTYSDIILPAKNAKSMDAWGYFNGVANLTTIPVQYRWVNNQMRTVGSADRRVNPLKVQAGMLTEIKYPTKGKTKFIYEPNQYYGVDDINKYNQTTLSSNMLQGTGNPSANPVLGPGIAIIPTCQSSICPVYNQIPFTIGGTGTAILTFDLAYTGGSILTQNKWQYARVRVFPWNDDTNPIYDSGIIKSSLSVYKELQLNGSGKILLEAYGQYMSVNNFQMRYLDDDNTPKNVSGPGLRIQEIQNYIDDVTLASKRRFTYTQATDGTKSSGRLIFDAVKKFDPEEFRTYDAINCSVGQQLPTTNWLVSYATIFRGQSPYFTMNEVSYTDVKEEVIDIVSNTPNGYTLSTFDFQKSDATQDGSINIENDWLRGNLISKKVYKPGNKIVYQEINNYIDDTSKATTVAGFKLYFRDNYIDCPSAELPAPDARPFENMGYSFTIPWHYLKSTQITETMYNSDNTVNGTILTTTTYNYNNAAHMQLSSTVKTTSLGEAFETKYFYPGDTEVSAEPCVTDLIAKNMFVPLKIQSFKSSVKQGEKKTVYKNWGNGLIMPELKQEAKATGALETRLQYVKRDPVNGNVLEVKQPGGASTSYIWGYNGVYPIAMIDYLTYNELLAGLGTTVDNLRVLTEAPSNLRALFTGAHITTYTYDPLKGVSSITSPNGIKTTYAYDLQGRFIKAKDADGNIISENAYNYKP